MKPPVNDLIAMEARLGAQNYEPLGVVLSRGKGVWVWDTQGNRYRYRQSRQQPEALFFQTLDADLGL
jgi:hypothetical protein